MDVLTCVGSLPHSDVVCDGPKEDIKIRSVNDIRRYSP
jgi:hypothetical protein